MSHIRISGIYPHLAITNEGHSEVGIGTAVVWAGKLWFTPYPASGNKGDDNKLYSIDKDLTLTAHPESVGGTHANRMFHKESDQLIIGPYFIDRQGKVRALNPEKTIGRFTGMGRHLKDPANFVYINTMEGGLYEVNVHTLAFKQLRKDRSDEYADSSLPRDPKLQLPGVHGKGGYTGQGHFYFTNNGIGGVLAEWDGNGDPQQLASWIIVDQEKHTEVTGPGGLYGEKDSADPIWSLGWDKKSALLRLREDGVWRRYRLPKGSYTQDADHGWYTEWPRIRTVEGFGRLMFEHGLFYWFPEGFSKGVTGGIKAIALHLKMIADCDVFNNEIVFACDDASCFDNAILGRQQSNLWFTSPKDLEKLGRPAGWAGIYLNEILMGGVPSDPILYAGFDRHVLHIQTDHYQTAHFIVEADGGDGKWKTIDNVAVKPYGYTAHVFDPSIKAEWIRLIPENDVSNVRASLDYLPASRPEADKALIEGLAEKPDKGTPALLHAGEGEDLKLNILKNGRLYEIGGDMELRGIDDPKVQKHVESTAQIQNTITVDDKSVRCVGPDGVRFRLPRGNASWTALYGRGIREVVTERELINACGTIFELPRPESGGFRRIKPVTTHNRCIEDFASWRGMLVLSGVTGKGAHCVYSKDGSLGIWLGNVDDLWNFGPPRGVGGPCKDTPMEAAIPGDPYLMAGYLNKSVALSHDAQEDVEFTLLVDFAADDQWSVYSTIRVPKGETVNYRFPEGYSAHWIKVRVNRDCRATAWFVYE